jgi:MSHA biogenesis protein MshP
VISHRRQRGMTIMVAIFLIVVIASLAAFAVTAGTATRESTNLGLQADRALDAARAGTEWGAYRALVQNACVASTPFNLGEAALRGFRVTVRCVRTNHTEGATTYAVWDIQSFAQWSNFGAADYASRTVSVRVSNAP